MLQEYKKKFRVITLRITFKNTCNFKRNLPFCTPLRMVTRTPTSGTKPVHNEPYI